MSFIDIIISKVPYFDYIYKFQMTQLLFVKLNEFHYQSHQSFKIDEKF